MQAPSGSPSATPRVAIRSPPPVRPTVDDVEVLSETTNSLTVVMFVGPGWSTCESCTRWVRSTESSSRYSQNRASDHDPHDSPRSERTSETPRGELGTVMEFRALHMLLSALDPSDPSTVRVWCTEQALYKHFLTKILRCRQPNPVQLYHAPRSVPVARHMRRGMPPLGLLHQKTTNVALRDNNPPSSSLFAAM